nr:polysaccharide deacetylase family protein [uncultured Desulfobacter sp.]
MYKFISAYLKEPLLKLKEKLQYKTTHSAVLTLTFDDAPKGKGWKYSGTERTQLLIRKLKSKEIPSVVFYSNIKNDLRVKDPVKRLKQYSDAGHYIGNHTFDHADFDQLSYEEYIESINKCEESLNNLKMYRKWFRYPYLREGKKDQEKGRLIKKYLKDQGYQHGFITVEVYDWYIDSFVEKELRVGKKLNYKKLQRFYINMLLDQINFYNKMAMAVIGRIPVHSMLLHENDLNALFLEEIIDAIREKGHTIVSADRIFLDPINDQKWEKHHSSMRRIRSIAEQRGYNGQPKSKWLKTPYLNKAVKNSKLFSI